MSYFKNLSMTQTLQGDDANVFFRLSKVVYNSYKQNFSEMLPWAMLVSLAIHLGAFLLSKLSNYPGLNFIYTVSIMIPAMFYALAHLSEIKQNWSKWLIASLPYLGLVVIFPIVLGSVGQIISVAFVIALAYYMQEILKEESNIFDAYLDSISLTWRFNFRLFLFVFLPWMFVISLKIIMLRIFNIPLHGFLQDFSYWLLTTVMLPWFVFSYCIFYEYLKFEKSDANKI